MLEEAEKHKEDDNKVLIGKEFEDSPGFAFKH